MQLPELTQAYLLQSLGFAIINSFWQTGLLYVLYKIITNADKQMPSPVRYHFSIALIFTSFCWFIFTLFSSYLFLKDDQPVPLQIFANGLLAQKKLFNLTLPWLSLAYFICLGFYVTRFCKNLLANHFLQTKGLVKAPVDLRLFSKQVAAHMGIQKKVKVWLSAHVTVPSVSGFIKPVILLPAAITSHLTVQQVEAILLHELAHIKRHDYFLNMLQSFIEMILFFNPFAILLGRLARMERENCCDDWVINYKYNRRQYAEALIILEEHRSGNTHQRFALAATNNKKKLLLRVKRLFDTKPNTNSRTVDNIRFAGLIILLCGVILIAKPAMVAHDNRDGQAKAKPRLNLFKFENFSNERLQNVILKSDPMELIVAKKPASRKAKAKFKLAHPVEKEDFVNAYVNDELLTGSENAPVATNVVEKELAATKYYVKIEEQQSGKKQTNTYYLELNNVDGSVNIKPLIIMNNIKANSTTKSANDSLHTRANNLKKKRVTS